MFSLDNPGFSLDVSVQVDIHQPDVPSMTSSGSSAASSGDSTRRSCSLCHGRMSSFSFHQHLFCKNIENLNVVIIADVMSVCRGPRRR